MKTEVYTWRVSTDLKNGLEREAQRRKISVAAVLDLAARDWLSKGQEGTDSDEGLQRRLQEAASPYFGTLESSDATRSENVRKLVRQRLQRKHDR